jgi:16S rRNA (adenine1518-N6/adenine1519-N6)-dimethyltransferase
MLGLFLFLPFLAKYKNLTLKKSFGQHYLHDETYCERIAKAILQFDTLKIVEIGPGAGAITKYFPNDLEYEGVELDREKFDYLEKHFPEKKFSQLDVLKYPINEEILFCGNYPYNISGPIIFKTLENKEHIPVMIGMFQKEVAQRIVAVPRTKAYGILSVLCQCFYDCTILFDIPPGAFQPPPKVKSSLIEMKRNDNPYKIEDFNQFKILVKTAFGQRRKTLNNALKSMDFNLPEDVKSKRPEELSPERFAELYLQLYS